MRLNSYLTISNLDAVRHLGFDRQSILTLRGLRGLKVHQLIPKQCIVELLTIRAHFPGLFSVTEIALHFLRDGVTELHQTFREHRTIIGAAYVCFRVKIYCSISKREGLHGLENLDQILDFFTLP